MFKKNTTLKASLLLSFASLAFTPAPQAADALTGRLACFEVSGERLCDVFQALYKRNASEAVDDAVAIQQFNEGDVRYHPFAPKAQYIKYASLGEILGIPALNAIFTSNEPPAESKSVVTKLAAKALAYLVSQFQPEDGDVEFISGDPMELIELVKACYSNDDGNLLIDLPKYPFSASDDTIAESIAHGPFARYLQTADASKVTKLPINLRMDAPIYVAGLPEYSKYKTKDGLEPLGGEAFLHKKDGQFKTFAIQYKGKWYTPNSSEWDKMQRVVMATLSTDLTVVQHFLNTHILLAGIFCTATHRLPETHPLRELLHPYALDTLAINNYNSPILLNKGAMFPSLFSFPHDELMRVLSDKAKSFDVSSIDPTLKAAKHKLRGGNPNTEVMEAKIWSAVSAHVGQYIDTMYPTDKSLEKDKAAKKWYKDVKEHMANDQVMQYAGSFSKESLKKLVSLFMFTTTVEHNLVGTQTFNYLPWMNKIPSNVRSDGKPATKELVILSALLLLVTHPTAYSTVIDHSFTHLIKDAKLRGIAESLMADLNKIQAEIDQSAAVVGVQPKDLRLSVNS